MILDAYSQVTGVPTPFTQVYTGVEGGTADDGQLSRWARGPCNCPTRGSCRSSSTPSAGRSAAQTCSCERQQDSSVGQALHLNNGQTLNDKLRSPKARLNAWLTEKLSDADIVKRVFVAALCREPTAAESTKMTTLMKESGVTPAARREAIEDLFWAVLTSREFVFNH